MTSYIINDYQIYFKYTTIRIISNNGRTFQLESDDFINFDKVLNNNNITIKLNSNNIILSVDNNKYYIPEIREDIDFKDIQIIELKKIINQFDDKIKLLEEQVKTSENKIKLLTENIDKNSIYIDGCALSIPINITNITLVVTNNIIYITDYNMMDINYCIINYVQANMFTYNPSSFYNRFIGNNNNTKSIRLINSIDENIKKLEKLETLEIIKTSCHTNKPIYLDNLKYLNKLHTLTLTNCCDTFIKSIMPNTKLDNIKTLVINSYDTCCCPKCNNFIFNTNCLNILIYLPLLETLIIKESFHIWKTINNFKWGKRLGEQENDDKTSGIDVNKSLNCDESILPNLSHHYKFFTAAGYPRFTNYTRDFKDLLDYIFVDDNVEIKRVFPFPDEVLLSSEVALPSKSFPSDHISVVVDLKFKKFT
jgi:hypothetical protein